MNPNALDQLDRLLSLVRRCESQVACHPAGAIRSEELGRVVAELRVALSTHPEYTGIGLDVALAVASVDGLRIALVGVRARLADDQRRLSRGRRVDAA